MATGGGYDRHTGVGEISKDLPFGGGDDGAGGNLQNEILTAGTIAVIACTISATRSREVRAEVQVKKSVNLSGGAEDNVATVPTVTTIRATQWLELFAVHGRAPVASVAGRQMQNDPVYETVSHEHSFNRMRTIVYQQTHPNGIRVVV